MSKLSNALLAGAFATVAIVAAGAVQASQPAVGIVPATTAHDGLVLKAGVHPLLARVTAPVVPGLKLALNPQPLPPRWGR